MSGASLGHGLGEVQLALDRALDMSGASLGQGLGHVQGPVQACPGPAGGLNYV